MPPILTCRICKNMAYFLQLDCSYPLIIVYSAARRAMYQVQDQSIRPLTTAHLAQTMSLLVLSNQELRDRVLAEISSNPALELLEERVCPGCHRT
ncbi:MAG: hypothetical protein ACK2TX_02955, partial [Anaerolineales bacterium]